MVSRWSRTLSYMSRLDLQKNMEFRRDLYMVTDRSFSKIATVADVQPIADSPEQGIPSKQEINLNKLFWSKPSSLALTADSPLRIEDPKFVGMKHIMLKLMLFYSKQSKSIRGANVIYRRIVSQVDKPAIYNVFNLEQTFKTTFSLLVLHMWLCLRRLKEEGNEGVELGQYVYEIYNHDLELRVSKAGVNLLLTRWMKDLEKIFYGNIVAYDTAMLPEAKLDELANVIWSQEITAILRNVCMDGWLRNVFSDGDTSLTNDAASRAAQAMSRYVRREASCLSLTDRDTMFSGNFTFTSLQKPSV